MSDEEMAWILSIARMYGAIVFIWVGLHGAHPMLLPWSVWQPRVRMAAND